MFKYLLPVLICLCLFSCSAPEVAADNEHLDKEKMSEVMTDLTLMEAAVNLKITQDPKHPVDSSLHFNIYKQHNISKELYESSLHYYSERPKELKEIYDVVLEKLNQLKTSKP